ncbi:MAG TPA: LysR substrate-binding domain-containing protein, partial [Bacteroidales bacterium]
NDELIVFTSSQNKSVPQVVSAKELASLPLVLRERGSGTLEIIENSLQQYGVNLKSLQVLMYLGSTEAIKSFVKTGSGVGIVSRFAIEHELLSGIFRQINTSNIWFQRQFYFISPQGPEPSGLTKLFVNFLQNYYNLKL